MLDPAYSGFQSTFFVGAASMPWVLSFVEFKRPFDPVVTQVPMSFSGPALLLCPEIQQVDH